VPDPDTAPAVTEIFHLFADRGLSCKQITDLLNRPSGPPSPSHVDSSRNVRGDWAKSTIRFILKNPIYTGRLVWNRLDFATQREVGGTAQLRAREEWAVSEVTHLPLVSDALFAAAQERFKTKPRAQRGRQRRDYLLAGMVRCCSGHQPLSMYGRERKGHRYYCCDYARSYGEEAAAQIPDHGKWLYLREDALVPLVERFFAERIFGPMRLDKLARQLRAQARSSKKRAKGAQATLRRQVADFDRRIGLQIEALEKGIEPDLVGQRIAELRSEKEEIEAELRELGAGTTEGDPEELTDILSRLPDLSEALRKAPPNIKRQVFEAFCLQIRYDNIERRIEISATISEAVAKAFEKTKDLPEEVSRVTLRDIAGAGFEPATFGL
jgi:site-specific DNA recombinase